MTRKAPSQPREPSPLVSKEDEQAVVLYAALRSAGVPRPAGDALLAQGVTGAGLARCSMQWVMQRVADAGVELNEAQKQKLSWVTTSLGNVPLGSQFPPKPGQEGDADQRSTQERVEPRTFYFV